MFLSQVSMLALGLLVMVPFSNADSSTDSNTEDFYFPYVRTSFVGTRINESIVDR